MNSENRRIKVHTTLIPESAVKPAAEAPRARVNWKVLKHPKAEAGKRRFRFDFRARRRNAAVVKPEKEKLTAGEKLLRNASIACALLLTILALRNVDQPWTQQAADGIRRVVTMRIDLDESLGRLQFVRNLVPETSLVFWNMGAESSVPQPVVGTLVHEYNANQPWQEYQCAGPQEVYAVDAGQVTAVGQGASGDWTVLIDHEGGVQTVYAYLGQAIVKVGQQIDAGAQLGVTGEDSDARLYFEYRVGGVARNPGGATDPTGA